MNRIILGFLLGFNLLLILLATPGLLSFLSSSSAPNPKPPRIALFEFTDLVGQQGSAKTIGTLFATELENETGSEPVTLCSLPEDQKAPSFDELTNKAQAAGAQVLLWGTVNDFSSFGSSSSVSISLYAIDLETKETVWSDSLTRRFDDTSIEIGARNVVKDVAKRMVAQLVQKSA